MLPVFNAIGKLALTNSTVLIIGESGTGKELVAEALHLNSNRSKNPFIALNTPAIPKELLESELFGHEKGSFTGANIRRIGRFEQASEGTLFLDEIGDMPLELQTRLLRVLSDSSFYRVGGISSIKTNTRLITATNKNLESLVAEGLFREDLYHRLNVIKINLPPLRDRLDDIPELLDFFLEKSALELKIEKKVFSEDAIKRLKKYYWPGNIRQLQNLCHFASIMTPVNEITYGDIPSDFFVEKITNKSDIDWQNNLIEHVNSLYHGQEFNKIKELSNQFEKTVISAVLKLTNGKKVQSSEILGLGRNTLTRKILDLKIST
jgi:two-component system nitrogen regulation response regulator GlnG